MLMVLQTPSPSRFSLGPEALSPRLGTVGNCWEKCTQWSSRTPTCFICFGSHAPPVGYRLPSHGSSPELCTGLRSVYEIAREVPLTPEPGRSGVTERIGCEYLGKDWGSGRGRGQDDWMRRLWGKEGNQHMQSLSRGTADLAEHSPPSLL